MANRTETYAVSFPMNKGLRFMTRSALSHLVKDSIRFDLPELGQTTVYTDVHPWGLTVCWQKVDDGMTTDELIDSNIHGERVINL